MTFVHLRVRSDLSFLQSAARVDQIARAAAADGAPAVALTDVRMHGAWRFQQACAKAGVRPIHGLEVDKTLALHAATDEGLHNLIKIASQTRPDVAFIREHAAGLQGITHSRTWLEGLRDVFRGELCVEVQSMGGPSLAEMGKLAAEFGVPMVATHNVRYVKPADKAAYAALRALDTGGRVSDFEADVEWLHFMSSEDMHEYVLRDHPWLLENTLAYAGSCQAQLAPQVHMPRFDVPVDGWDEEGYLRAEVSVRLDRLYGDDRNEARPDVQERELYELDVICKMGFAGYFLVVADYIAWAKSQGILVGPGRGSGAGSLVAYALGITGLDPISHHLYFERFLNPDRVSLPDFDVDFQDNRRDEVIRYVAEKYGSEQVAQICNLGMMRGRAALKDANRVLGGAYALGERLSNAMGANVAGRPMELAAVVDEEHSRYADGEPMRSLLETDDEAQRVFDLALRMEGLHRQSGVHAAGVIVSDVPITDVGPTMEREGGGIPLTQWDWLDADSLGLVKFDFLGLSTLSVLAGTLENIRAGGREAPDLQGLIDDPTDPATFKLLASGETIGVFQVETAPMRALLRQMQCSSFEDVSATVALYRPGPMSIGSHIAYAKRKTGEAPVEPIHPELAEPLAEVLDETYGLLVYQEQIMAAARIVAGYTLAGADMLRRAMGKKDPVKMAAEEDKLRAGMTERGFSEAAADALWEAIKGNADYSFNKAHSAAYGAITYQTAYLKAHFPSEYMAALLTSVRDDKTSTAMYLTECRRMGIDVLPPDANLSLAGYSVEDGKIRFGLAAVHGLGETVVTQLTSQPRQANTLLEWIATAPPAARNKKTVEALVKAGGFNYLGVPRRALLEAVPAALEVGKVLGFAHDHGFPVEAGEVALPSVEEFSRSQILQLERETLGLYVSDHPLAIMAQDVAALASHSIGELRSLEDKSRVQDLGDGRRAGRQEHEDRAASPGPSPPSRTWTAASRCCCSRTAGPSVSHVVREGSVVVITAASRCATAACR
jgi:DNA polymerase-3 subunit alpha